jgi:hypothetical protein
MKYCTKCGRELFDEAVLCPGCGCTIGVNPVSPVVSRDPLLLKLSERLKINGIIWIIIAVIQIMIGVLGAWFTLLVGVLNIVSAVKDLNYSKTVLENPTGIIGTFEPVTSPIITLGYNLLIGGVIGAVGSVYYFVALRGFVMENKTAFQAIENSAANAQI